MRVADVVRVGRGSEWASISVQTVKRIESSSEIRGAADTLWKIQKALEAAGVEFIPEEGGRGPGVRFKAPPKSSKPRRSRRRQSHA